MRRWLEKLTEKDGFYIILFICVCVVAVTTVFASKRNLKEEEKNLSQVEDFIIIEDDLDLESSLNLENIDEKDLSHNHMEDLDEELDENEEEIKEAMAEDSEEIEEEEDIEDDLQYVEEIPPSSVAESMILPVNGQIVLDYTKDNLIYSETLEEWTAHKGIDIQGQEGSQVVAALSGVVQEVYKDELWGTVIIIDHGDGLLTKYANLAEEVLISEGARVNKGEAIGKIGKTALIEIMMEPHIHFEVIQDGVNVDPKEYIQALAY